MIYLLTGAPGAGKSTVAVERSIWRYAAQGRRVVANFPMDFSPVCRAPGSKLARATTYVLPDRPTRDDLDAIGHGGEHEEVAGLLVIDEAGGWLSARSWQGKEREAIIDWLTQSRKRRWDVVLIAQAASMLDRMVRDAVCECVVRIRRLDRWKPFGIAMPRVHIAIVRYGLEANGPILERWVYRGQDAQKCFGSYRLFGADSARYSTLTAMHTRFRYLAPRTHLDVLRGLPGGTVWYALGCLATGVVYAFLSPWLVTEPGRLGPKARLGALSRSLEILRELIPANLGPEPVAVQSVAYGPAAEVVDLAARRRARGL